MDLDVPLELDVPRRHHEKDDEQEQDVDHGRQVQRGLIVELDLEGHVMFRGALALGC
jgi:hypothetical protein